MLEPAFILYNIIEQNQYKPYCCGIGTIQFELRIVVR